MGQILREKYGSLFKVLLSVSHAAAKIDETKVYQEANPETKKYMDILAKENIMPGSGLAGAENFEAFYNAITKEGKSGLILMEHYSNMDLPALFYLLNEHGEEWASDLSKRIVAIAGMKLNEADPGVRSFAESFTRVVIYPTRSLDAVGGKENISEEEKQAEEQRARKINFAAMRAMDKCKKDGQAILVFPSGTRYRPGKPETKRGLREIDSYLRLFDVMILVSTKGNVLTINPENPNDMLADIMEPDVITMKASPLIDCRKFRKDVLDSLPADEEDPKQKTIDKVMEYLEKQHEAM